MSSGTRLRLACRAMAAIFLCVAAARLALAAAPLVDPHLLTTEIVCESLRCRAKTDLARLLPPEDREAAIRTAGRRSALEALVGAPSTRRLLFAGEAVRALPAFLLFLFLALALRRFGAGRRFGFDGVAWLRRAAAASLAAVAAQPVADTIRATALSPVTTGRSQLFFLFDGPAFFWGLLLAGGVWVCVRALDEARRVERELAAIV